MPLLPAAEAALRAALADLDVSVRHAAAVALWNAGVGRDEALAVLFVSLRSPRWRGEAIGAQQALLALRPPPGDLLEGLLTFATDPARVTLDETLARLCVSFAGACGSLVSRCVEEAWSMPIEPWRRPKIRVSRSEFAPSRLPPCTDTQAHSPAA
jgi:hypothetical protein